MDEEQLAKEVPPFSLLHFIQLIVDLNKRMRRLEEYFDALEIYEKEAILWKKMEDLDHSFSDLLLDFNELRYPPKKGKYV